MRNDEMGQLPQSRRARMMLRWLAYALKRLADWDAYVLTPKAKKMLCIRHGWRDDFHFGAIYQTQTCWWCEECRRVSDTPIVAALQQAKGGAGK
jgi:hypothetical protein